MSTRFNIAPPPHVKVRWIEGKVMGSRAIQWLTFRMHRNFIWGVVPMSYPCCTCVVTVSYLPYHVIIFQKLLLSLYQTCVRVNVLASQANLPKINLKKKLSFWLFWSCPNLKCSESYKMDTNNIGWQILNVVIVQCKQVRIQLLP